MNQVILADAVCMPRQEGIYFSKPINVQEFLAVIRKSKLQDTLIGYVQDPDISELLDEVLNDEILHVKDVPEINDRDSIVVMLLKSNIRPERLSLGCFQYSYIYFHDGSDLEIREV